MRRNQLSSPLFLREAMLATTPGTPTVTAWDDTTVSLSVVAVAGATDYVWYYRAVGDTTWRTFVDAVSSSNTRVITGLTGGTTYQFRVVAIVGGETTRPSAAVQRKTAQVVIDTYNASGTWASTGKGVHDATIQVEAWASGASGRNGSDVSGGAGGGAGAYSRLNAFAFVADTAYTVTVGAGGAAGAEDDGADSSFKDAVTLLAKAPSGQTGGTTVGGVGNTKFAGGSGGNAFASGTGGGSGGGGSAGDTGAGGNGTTAAASAGAAGGVAGSGTTHPGAAGGAGGAGGGDGVDGVAGNAPGGGGGGGGAGSGTGGGDFTALRALVTSEWRFEEVAPDADAVDSVGGWTVPQVGSPDVDATDHVYRQLNGSNYFGIDDLTGQDDFARVRKDYSISATWTPENVTGIRQIITMREAGSGNGRIVFTLRQEGTDLKLYLGDGASFEAFTVGTVVIGVQQHFVFNLVYDTGVCRYRHNGGAAATVTTVKQMTAMGVPPPGFGLGGLGGELFVGKLYLARDFLDTVLSDAEMLLDYQDPRGKGGGVASSIDGGAGADGRVLVTYRADL